MSIFDMLLANAMGESGGGGGGGSSDFSAAQVTIINNANETVYYTAPIAVEEDEYDDRSPALCFASNGFADSNNTLVIKVALYKGTAVITLGGGIDVSQVTLTGDIVPLFEDGLEYYVTGNGTITIS